MGFASAWSTRERVRIEGTGADLRAAQFPGLFEQAGQDLHWRGDWWSDWWGEW